MRENQIASSVLVVDDAPFATREPVERVKRRLNVSAA
jgi:hypothetical protein